MVLHILKYFWYVVFADRTEMGQVSAELDAVLTTVRQSSSTVPPSANVAQAPQFHVFRKQKFTYK